MSPVVARRRSEINKHSLFVCSISCFTSQSIAVFMMRHFIGLMPNSEYALNIECKQHRLVGLATTFLSKKQCVAD